MTHLLNYTSAMTPQQILAYITNGKNTFGQMIETSIRLPKLIGAMDESAKL